MAFATAAAVLPLLLLALLELALRLANYGGDMSVFVAAPPGRGVDPPRMLRPNPALGRRYFVGDPNPPGPSSTEAFEADKADGELRVVVLGESTAAGYPYMRNGTFSRVLADVLTDAAGGRPVTVINVALPAVSSFVPADMIHEVLAVDPDAIVIYAGHNEYYGVYGVVSQQRIGGSPTLVRLALKGQRLRIVQLLRNGISAIRDEPASPGGLVSRMEQLAGVGVPFGGAEYHRGLEQIASNLDYILDAAHSAGVRVFVGSQASNLRDQPPFVRPAGSPPTAADTAFSRASAALAAGNRAMARRQFALALDLDPVRFRASADINRTLQRIATEGGATYVPTAEAIAAAAPDSIPGAESFFEHVHPRRPAIVVLGRTFFESMVQDPRFAPGLRADRAKNWAAYERQMELTPVDETLARLTVQVITTRWPFVPASQSQDFLTAFRPTTPVDSGAFAAMIGAASWSSVKLEMAKRYVAAGFPDSAVAEYRGVMREFPRSELPARLAGLLLEQVGRDSSAIVYLREAQARGAGADVAAALRRIEGRSRRGMAGTP